MKKIKPKTNKRIDCNNKSNLIFTLFIVIISIVISAAVSAGTDCKIACNSVLDCQDNNPYIVESCENPGTCNAECKYTIPDNVSYISKSTTTQLNINNYKVNVNENINQIEQGNMTSIVGTLNIDKGITKDYFLFVIQDPSGILTNNIKFVHFNMKPYKVTDSAIFFLLQKNQSVYFISYYIEPQVAEKLINKTNITKKGLLQNSTVRTPTITEKAQIFFKPSDLLNPDLFIRIIKVIVIVLLLGVGIIIGYFYYRKRNEKTKIKILQ